MGIDQDGEGMVYSVGIEDDDIPSSEYDEFSTIEEAQKRLDDWTDIVDENIADQTHYCPECDEEIDDPDDDCPYCMEEDEEDDMDESGITGMHL